MSAIAAFPPGGNTWLSSTRYGIEPVKDKRPLRSPQAPGDLPLSFIRELGNAQQLLLKCTIG